MGKRRDDAMVFCPLCKADAFVKVTLGSKVILDCNHAVSAGVILAQRHGDDPTMPRPTREPWPEPDDAHTARAKAEGTSRNVAKARNLGDVAGEPRKHSPLSPLNNTATAAKHINNLLRRKK